MKLIVGLGNPGLSYARTRHNLGFMITDQLARDLGATWKSESKLQANVATAELDGRKLILAQPTTFMNASGEAVQRLMQFYKIAPADVWVVFDDVDLPFGRLRLRASGGSAGGHQGVTSTIAHIGPHFVRVRVGISLNNRAVEPSEVYVLKPFNDGEQAQLPELLSTAASIVKEQLALETPSESTFDLL